MRARERAADKPLNAWIRALSKTSELTRHPNVTFPALLSDLADEWGDRPALMSEDACLTYRGLADRSNQYAHWALANDVRSADVVALLMPNCPEYMAIWLGITHVRGVVALLNTNLGGEALAHSIKIVNPRHIIVDSSLLARARSALAKSSADIQLWVFGPGAPPHLPRIDLECARYPAGRVERSECQPPTIADAALYIYSSGTTGLPKAARISHFRILEWSYWFAGMMGAGAEDRMYDCLPMYHSTGGVVAPGSMLVSGGAMVIRPSFSARRFWDDIVTTDCTLFQYIGELCRYLLNSPTRERETEHQLRLCCGNGLRPEIWEAFQDRFRIPRIFEFYASTEGNVSLYNCEGKPGAIGRVPPFLGQRFPVRLIRCDDSGEPVRDDRGFCVGCDTGEAGEAIGKINDDDGPNLSAFDGYTDETASNQKILRDVLSPGDKWYRTGDLMRRDQAGFFYFVDRLGDTFRWKGENVSTTEVSQIICGYPEVDQAVVYGVAVPGTEGRAGMAALLVKQNFDIASFRRHLAECLPAYARPIFVRIAAALDMTGTFKPTKVQLTRDGFDPGLTDDDIWFDDVIAGAFVKLDPERHAALMAGSVRL